MLFWGWCSKGLYTDFARYLQQVEKHFVAKKIKRLQYFFKSINVEKDSKWKLTTAVESRGGLSDWVRQTLWQWGMVALPPLTAVTLVIIASLVVSGLGRIFISGWLERLLLNEGGLAYLWTKEANVPAASVWKHRRRGRSLVTLLIYDWWLKIHTVKDSVSLSWQRNICLRNYIWSCNKSYVLSKRPHLSPSSNENTSQSWH